MAEQRLLSIEEAAVYLGISPRSIRTFIADTRLPAIRLGRRVLLDKEQLDKWIACQDRVAAAAGDHQELETVLAPTR
jgi:excisionase family DNA binding protein